MVKDDKDSLYKHLNRKVQSNNSNENNSSNYSKPSSKFSTIPSNDRINLYSATCAECHHEVRVNFEPVLTEPFYCDFCYNNHRIHHHTDNK